MTADIDSSRERAGCEPSTLTPWCVDAARRGDGPSLVTLFNRCSADTVYRRFFGRLPAFPPAYLAAVLAEEPARHDAVVIRYGDGLHVAGLAGVAAGEDGAPAELGVLVADAWQRRGLGAAMVEVLLARARGRGVGHLLVSVLPGRSAVLRPLGRKLALQTVSRSSDTVTAVFALPAETDRLNFDIPSIRRQR